jgi:pimeloyl-ACP methyl ester carboxylesterase
VVFQRHPLPSGAATENLLEVGGTALSGLIAVPSGRRQPRALIVALHGAGMHAGYFHTTTAPGLSLLELGSQLGFTVWAPDRPGIGASADLPDHRITLFAQASLLLDAIDQFATSHPVGAGVFLVGHSYGLKVAWTMAAERRGPGLLGIDGAGSGARYAFDWSSRGDSRRTRAPGDGGDSWGPTVLYPRGALSRVSLPLHPMPSAQAAEGSRWPDDLRSMAPRIRIPMRLTFGEFERLWPTDEAHFDELRTLLRDAPQLSIEIEPAVGHNVSLGWAARAYHLKVLAFAESCVLRRQVARADPT